MAAPLAGIRVVEAATRLGAPSTAALLAGLDAEEVARLAADGVLG